MWTFDANDLWFSVVIVAIIEFIGCLVMYVVHPWIVKKIDKYYEEKPVKRKKKKKKAEPESDEPELEFLMLNS